MKSFIGTSVFRIIVFLAGRIYMSNYQTDALYNFLNISNPATKAVTQCASGYESLGSGINNKLDSIIEQLENTTTIHTGSMSGTITPSTGALNQIFYTSGSKKQ